MQMIATRLDTVATSEIWSFLSAYFQGEHVERVLIGYPVQLNNQPSDAVRYINPFIQSFIRKFPGMVIEQVDERFTSRLAQQAMLEGGLKKSDRQNKALVDGISATIMLQSWLEQYRQRK